MSLMNRLSLALKLASYKHLASAELATERKFLAAKFNENHDEVGRFTFGDGGGGLGKSPGKGYSHSAYLRDGKIYTNNVNDAVRALTENRAVVLDQPRQVSTLIDKLRSITKDMEARGEKAPNFNLCNVSVSGTNLFCADSMGFKRIEMPQVKNENAAAFRKHLIGMGAKITDGDEKASYLRATQSELNGSKVAGIAGRMRDGTYGKDDPIFVSKDNYILDGHHRWAATVAVDSDNNKLGDVTMPISRVNMGITDLLVEANKFSSARSAIKAMVDKYSDDEPRDYHGRWTTGGGEGPARATARKKDWVNANPHRTIAANMSAAKGNQQMLAGHGSSIASAVDKGTKFVDPGPKTDLNRIEQKAATRGAHGITDYTRAAFVVPDPERADLIVDQLRDKFPNGVIDEGWKKTPVGYIDRTALVRYPDGQVGEVQIKSPDMNEAAKTEGHLLYEKLRTLPIGDPGRAPLAERMQQVYKAALERGGAAWNATAGRAIRVAEKSVSKLWASIMRPSLPTSASSTLIQALLTKAQASPGSQRAAT